MDVSDGDACVDVFKKAQFEFGRVDILVNNAGILRDKMIFNMSEEEFDLVVKVHLKGHFNFIQHACRYWKNKSKADGKPVFGRLISTSSESRWLRISTKELPGLPRVKLSPMNAIFIVP